MAYNKQHKSYDKHRNRKAKSSPLPKFDENWIKQGANASMNNFCDLLGKSLKQNGISSSQLRNIYGEIMRIKQKGFKNEQSSFYLLRPKIAYIAGRINGRDKIETFKNDFIGSFFTPAFNAVDENNEATFDNFQKIFEAVLAYHKFHGGND